MQAPQMKLKETPHPINSGPGEEEVPTPFSSLLLSYFPFPNIPPHHRSPISSSLQPNFSYPSRLLILIAPPPPLPHHVPISFPTPPSNNLPVSPYPSSSFLLALPSPFLRFSRSPLYAAIPTPSHPSPLFPPPPPLSHPYPLHLRPFLLFLLPSITSPSPPVLPRSTPTICHPTFSIYLHSILIPSHDVGLIALLAIRTPLLPLSPIGVRSSHLIPFLVLIY